MQLDGEFDTYHFPVRREQSLVFASWNIRKFGALKDDQGQRKKSKGSMDMIIRFCQACDLIAVQEVLEDISSIEHLVEQLNANGAQFNYIVSDVTGQKPGARDLAERFCFVYNSNRISLGHVASDLTFDRSAVLNNINNAYAASFESEFSLDDHAGVFDRLMNWISKTGSQLGKTIKKFVQFMRSPHIVEFIVHGTDDTDYQLYCINAHLVSGATKVERSNEFFALLEWLLIRSEKDVARAGKVFLLMADLNLDFQSNADKRKRGIEDYVTNINADRGLNSKVNFPFLDPPHFTNARRTQTFDHIAYVADDDRWPRARNNDARGTLGEDEFDYRMFDFVQLFMDAGPGKLPDGTPDFARFEHDFTDHMPIWFRMPVPHSTQQRFPI